MTIRQFKLNTYHSDRHIQTCVENTFFNQCQWLIFIWWPTNSMNPDETRQPTVETTTTTVVQFECCHCGDTIDDGDHIEHTDWKHRCHDCFHDNHTSCSECGEYFDDNDLITVRDEFFCHDCVELNHFECVDCGERTPNRERLTIHNGDHICEWCGENYHACEWCGDLFHSDEMTRDDDDDYPYCDSCRRWTNDGDRLDNNLSHNQWFLIKTQRKQPDQPMLTRCESSEKMMNYLWRWYWMEWSDWPKHMCSFRDVYESTTLTFDNTMSTKIINDLKIQFVQKFINLNSLRSNKYTKPTTSIVSWSWKNVTVRFIDNVWKTQTKTESIKSIVEYHKKRFNMVFDYDESELFDEWFDVVLSNRIDDKIEQSETNNTFGSCQIPSNRRCLSRWFHDFFNNGSLCVITIRHKWRVCWRMVSRRMYTNDNHEYLFVDRLYYTDVLTQSNTRSIVYSKVIDRLSSKFDIILSKHTSHDAVQINGEYVKMSVFDHVKTVSPHLKFITPTSNVRSPIRHTWMFKSWYYHDSWSVTYIRDDGLIYDYLSKNKFYILEKKQWQPQND